MLKLISYDQRVRSICPHLLQVLHVCVKGQSRSSSSSAGKWLWLKDAQRILRMTPTLLVFDLNYWGYRCLNVFDPKQKRRVG